MPEKLMQPGFLLFIDEAGDEGIEAVRPVDPNGSSEYFVLAGVLIRVHRRNELLATINAAKQIAGLDQASELHFRDVAPDKQLPLVKELARLQVGLIAVVSNKRNMRGYRNRRVEAKNMEVLKSGKAQPQKYNWFYNHMFRYLLETASAECARWTNKAYGQARSIEIVFSHRRNFRYSQTAAYLFKMRTERHGGKWFNNKQQVEWSVVDPFRIDSARARAEPSLQFADCVASSIFRSVDEDNFGAVIPEFIEALTPRFVRRLGAATPAGYGFKLLPDGFCGPVSQAQARSLKAVGFTLPVLGTRSLSAAS